MGEIVAPVSEVVKCIAPFMKRQLKYVCCFPANVRRLTEEANELEAEKAALQLKIDEAENDGAVIDPGVVNWMKKIDDILQKKSELDTEINRVGGGGGCLCVRSRYSASRGAVKAAAAMKQKREDRAAITEIAHLPPPAPMVPDTLGRPMTDEFKSREKLEQYLMTLLKDEKIKKVGICGMGGIGKTNLAHKIRNRVLVENVFGECVMSVLSWTVNKKRIQEDIAAQLDLKFKEHEKGLLSRAASLRRRLSRNRILIVLDDVWEHLDLEELGIPCGPGGGCTILLTSRNKSVLTSMDIDEANVLEMQILTEGEAWSLFKGIVGTCLGQFPSLALEVVNECKGLPLALTTVAGALKDKKEEYAWESALQQLMSSNPEDLPDVLPDVYTPLRLSYDYLRSANAKLIFLLCALFPEDFDISLRDLTAYAMGLRIFEGIGDLEQARDKTESLVEMLKSHFLLLEGRDEGHVRMHDIVRDVAVFIASRESPLINPEENFLINQKNNGLIRRGYDSTWISPGEKIELSKGSIFPKLRLLMIDNESAIEGLRASDISFEGMKELNVLSIKSNSSLTSFPLPQNLKTLILVECESLKTISVVGELINLEILMCCDCHNIEEFPSEILKNLRWLEITNCQALWKIESDNGNFKNQNLRLNLERLVLRYLPNLEVFSHGIERIEFPQLTQLEIEGCPRLKGDVSSPGMGDDDHSLHLLCKHKVSLGKLRKLGVEGIRNCNQVLCCPGGSFTHLQEIHLHDLPRLQNFCNSAPELPQLLKLHISFCPNMTSFNSTTPNMKSLESLRIWCCSMMEHVFLWSEEEIVRQSSRHITFPKLHTLELVKLPRLTSLYKGVESIEIPLLTRLRIETENDSFAAEQIHLSSNLVEFDIMIGYPTAFHTSTSYGRKMHLELEKDFILGDWIYPLLRSTESLVLQGEGSSKLVSQRVPEFRSLKRLKIQNAKMIRLSDGTTTNGFPFLMSLCLKDIANLEEIHNGPISLHSFSNLQELRLEGLPKLKVVPRFCNLSSIYIVKCDRLQSLCPGNDCLLHLKSLTIRSCSNLEQVVMWDEEDGNDIGKSRRTIFPELRKLELHDLPRLASFCRGIECPLLTRMEIVKSPNLRTLVASVDKCSDDSLLLFCEAEDVDDVVAISIAEKKSNLGWKSFPREETNERIDELDPSSVFPNLRFSFINKGPRSGMVRENFQFSDDFDVSSIGYYILRSQAQPFHRMHSLENLRKLILESCETLEDISIVGKFVCLEILFCQRCDSIEEVPVEIGGLNHLKLLNISFCRNLNTIAAGVIESLTTLEELTLIQSFKKWGQGKNAVLSELESLSHLSTLRIEIEDVSLAAQQIHLPNLPKFNIIIGSPTASFRTSRSYGREMQVVMKTDFSLGDWIHQLLGRTESLVLQGDCSSKLVPLVVQLPNLKQLMFQNAKMTKLSEGTTTVFPDLECLCLQGIDDLEDVHKGEISPDSFKNLQDVILVDLPKLQHLCNVVPPPNISSVHIAKCNSLSSVFSSDKAGDYPSRLERIRIRCGSMLEQVVLRNEEGNGERHRRTGKLQFLDLHNLRRFKSLYNELDSIHFTFGCQESWTRSTTH